MRVELDADDGVVAHVGIQSGPVPQTPLREPISDTHAIGRLGVLPTNPRAQ